MDESPFRDVVKRHDQQFISYDEAIRKLASVTGSSFSEVAKALKIENSHRSNTVWVSGAERALNIDHNGGYLEKLLDNTIRCGTIFPVEIDDYGHEIMPEDHGWIRQKLIDELMVWWSFKDEHLETLRNPDYAATEIIPQTDAELVIELQKTQENLRKTKEENDLLKSHLVKAQIEIDELRRLATPKDSSPLHYTLLMKAAIEVQRDYWEDLEPQEKQEIIIHEIMKKYSFTKEQAKAVERVACPVNRKK